MIDQRLFLLLSKKISDQRKKKGFKNVSMIFFIPKNFRDFFSM